MATYYADGTLTTGANNGSSWADAWQGEAGLQTLFDTLTAGDIGYIRNTFALTGTIDIDQNSGTDGSPVRVIGCNAAGTNDGTKATIDADSAAAHCIGIDDIDYWYIENVEFANATGDNVFVAATDNAENWVFHRCDSHDAGACGFGSTGANKNFYRSIFFACRSYDNTTRGFERGYYGRYIGCSAIGNGSVGFEPKAYCTLMHCIAHNNTTTGIYLDGHDTHCFWCVCDGNGGDGIQTQVMSGVVACRLTNNGAYGLDISTATVLELYNFYSGNASGTVNGTIGYPNDKGSSTQLTSGTVGYEDLSGDKFNLRVGAAGYRTEIDLGGGNYIRTPRGLPTVMVPRLHHRD